MSLSRPPAPVDAVAVILAVALTVVSIMVGIALVVNVIEGHNPAPTLGESTTQILTAIMGGLIGILGTYIGSRTRPPG